MLLFVIILVGLLAYGISTRTDVQPSSADIAIVVDNSSSQVIRCDALPVMALAEMQPMNLGKRSELSVFKLGSPESSFEPVPTLRSKNLPRRGVSLAGKGAKLRKDIERACAESIKPVDYSSIYRAAQVTLEHLQRKGEGNPDTPSKLVLVTDMEETVSSDQLESGNAQKLPNAGIDVVICGYAVTDGGGPRGPRTDALIAKWRARFADPARVTFKPYCEGWTAPPTRKKE